MVELTAYNGIPHLLIPVVTDPKKASGALNWAVMEMTKRYQLFAQYNVRNLQGFNKKVEEVQNMEDASSDDLKKMPQIVVIVDELADLMMVAHGEVEDSIVRLSQLARAAGIHLVIATQRPSVDVITGLIKANVPSRIAFAVSSGVDSRTILDMNGAEKLLGKGDMLFYPTGYPKPVRVQGAFISDDEVVSVVNYIKKQYGESDYDEEISQSIESSVSGTAAASGGDSGTGYDELFEEAGRLVIEKDKASIGNLQRVFRIGFNRAARIMDQLCDAGVVGPEEGTKPRRILMTMDQFEDYMSL
jgi:S-DNA-T family DNA segregation ATPase FtsK/SpoIIIE